MAYLSLNHGPMAVYAPGHPLFRFGGFRRPRYPGRSLDACAYALHLCAFFNDPVSFTSRDSIPACADVPMSYSRDPLYAPISFPKVP